MEFLKGLFGFGKKEEPMAAPAAATTGAVAPRLPNAPGANAATNVGAAAPRLPNTPGGVVGGKRKRTRKNKKNSRKNNRRK